MGATLEHERATERPVSFGLIHQLFRRAPDTVRLFLHVFSTATPCPRLCRAAGVILSLLSKPGPLCDAVLGQKVLLVFILLISTLPHHYVCPPQAVFLEFLSKSFMNLKEEWPSKQVRHFAPLMKHITPAEFTESLLPSILKACKRSGDKAASLAASLLSPIACDMSNSAGVAKDTLFSQLMSFMLFEVYSLRVFLRVDVA